MSEKCKACGASINKKPVPVKFLCRAVLPVFHELTPEIAEAILEYELGLNSSTFTASNGVTLAPRFHIEEG
jgi:hypothetical protein